MITLGIIGVVAAMTLPSLINNTEKQERREALKKAYSVLQQALLMYQKDSGEIPGSSAFDEESAAFKKAIIPYFIGAIDCGKGTENSACVYGSSSSSESTSPYKNYSGTTKANYTVLDDGQYIVADGMMYFFENSGVSPLIFVSVDVNGYRKGPNQLGRDLFMFELTETGKLVPSGAKGTYWEDSKYCSLTDRSGNNGYGCTYKALYDPLFWKGKK